MTADTIVIKAPSGTKSRWVHEAQKRGMKLSDWVINRIDHENASTATTISKIKEESLWPGEDRALGKS